MFRSQVFGAHHRETDWLDSQTSSRYTLVRALASNIKVQYLKGKVMLNTDNRLNWQCNPFERHQLWPRWNCHLFHLSRHMRWKNEQDASAIQCWPSSAEEKHPRRLAKRKSTSLTPCHTLPRDEFAVTDDDHFNFFVAERAWEDRHPLRPSKSWVMPAKNKELKEYIQTCETWMAFEQDQCKESLISHDYSRETFTYNCTHLPTVLLGTTPSCPDSY